MKKIFLTLAAALCLFAVNAQDSTATKISVKGRVFNLNGSGSSGGGGSADGNDFLTTASLVGRMASFTIPNQAVVNLDLSPFALESQLTGYLPLSGGELTGSLSIGTHFTVNDIGQSWRFEQGGFGLNVGYESGVGTGIWPTIAAFSPTGIPTEEFHITTKSYVDAQVAAGGGSGVDLTSTQTISGQKTFTSTLQADGATIQAINIPTSTWAFLGQHNGTTANSGLFVNGSDNADLYLRQSDGNVGVLLQSGGVSQFRNSIQFTDTGGVTRGLYGQDNGRTYMGGGSALNPVNGSYAVFEGDDYLGANLGGDAIISLGNNGNQKLFINNGHIDTWSGVNHGYIYAGDGYFQRDDAGGIVEVIGTGTEGIVGTDTNHDLVLRRNNNTEIRIEDALTTINNSTTVSGNQIQVAGDSPRIRFGENSQEDFYILADGENLSIRGNDNASVTLAEFKDDGRLYLKNNAQEKKYMVSQQMVNSTTGALALDGDELPGDIGFDLFSNNDPGSTLGNSYSGVWTFYGDTDGRNFRFIKYNGNDTSLYVQLAADDGTFSAPIDITGIDYGEPQAGTGSALNMEYHGGYFYNMAPVDTKNHTTYTISGTPALGGYAKVLVNAPTQPTVTGATLIAGSTFQANTNMYMIVEHNGVTTQYYFLEI